MSTQSSTGMGPKCAGSTWYRPAQAVNSTQYGLWPSQARLDPFWSDRGLSGLAWNDGTYWVLYGLFLGVTWALSDKTSAHNAL